MAEAAAQDDAVPPVSLISLEVCTAKGSTAALFWEDRDHAISQGKGEEVVLGQSGLCMES